METVVVKPSKRNSFTIKGRTVYLAPVPKALAMLLIGRSGVLISANDQNSVQTWNVPSEIADFILLAGYGPSTFKYQKHIKRAVSGNKLMLTPELKQEIAALNHGFQQYDALCHQIPVTLDVNAHLKVEIHREPGLIDILTYKTNHTKLETLATIKNDKEFIYLIRNPVDFLEKTIQDGSILYSKEWWCKSITIDGTRYYSHDFKQGCYLDGYYSEGATIKFGKFDGIALDWSWIPGILTAIQDDLPLNAALALQPEGA